MSLKILPSILSVPNDDVQAAIDGVIKYADGIHYDVMDGQFVPPTTFTVDDFAALNVPTFTDIHLMVDQPDEWVRPFAQTGADLLSIHYEAKQRSVMATLDRIKAAGCLAGLAIKPQTLVTDVDDSLWDYCDVALIMSVEPGWGGQSFMDEVLDKVRALRERYPEKDINIDGGINDQTAIKSCQAGCNMLVSGSYIFNSPDYQHAIETLRSAEDAA